MKKGQSMLSSVNTSQNSFTGYPHLHLHAFLIKVVYNIH